MLLHMASRFIISLHQHQCASNKTSTHNLGYTFSQVVSSTTCDHMQDSVVITVKNAWGSPAAAGSVTVHSSAADTSGKGKATPNGPQTLQTGSSTGEYLYSTADLHDHPGTYK